jgi:hypothetical protein
LKIGRRRLEWAIFEASERDKGAIGMLWKKAT